MTVTVNLYAGPGAGKSTSAAYLYYRLKSDGHNAELVREYIKNWAWEGRKVGRYDQMYILGKQIRGETLLLGQVSHMVTDSPLWLNAYYTERYTPLVLGYGIRTAIQQYYRQQQDDGHVAHHVVLERTKPYVASGRYETEREARAADEGIVAVLEAEGVSFTRCCTNEAALSDLYNRLIVKQEPYTR